ncbi:MAG: hypothetical protein R6W78_08000 [Bacteroidales bacterium]
MKKQTFILAIFSLFVIGLISCEKEEIINNPTFQLKFITVTSETNLKSTSANSIQFSTGYIILENIEFQLESDTDSLEMAFEIDAFITIDFASGVMTPDLSTIEIVSGYYTELELEFELWDQTEQPSIYLEGTWTDANGTPRPIKLIMPLGQTFSLEIEGEFMVQENSAMTAYITIDPNVWFMGEAGELLPSATANEDDIIVISPDHNYNIYDIIKDAIDEFSEVEIEME